MLASLLSDEACYRQNAQLVPAAFETVRHACTCSVKRTSHEAGDVYEHAAAGIGADEAKLIENLETRFE